MKRPHLVKLVVVACLLCASATAQSPAGAVGHFSKEGLSFDYPAGWTLDDRSSEKIQHLILRRPGSSVLVMVVAQREPAQTVEQLLAARNSVTMPYVASLARQLGSTYVPAAGDGRCLEVGERFATGFRIPGQLELDPATGEVYSIVLGQRLVHLVYIRADKEEAQGAPLWKSVLDTLKVAPPANPSPEAEQMGQVVTGGVLNGKVVEKPQPLYPTAAKAKWVQGTVTVQVVVDERGKVVSATPVSGPALLQAPAAQAARMARFSPTTLCGRPVKVSGVITYNFVLR